jgi:hypothetical protein
LDDDDIISALLFNFPVIIGCFNVSNDYSNKYKLNCKTMKRYNAKAVQVYWKKYKSKKYPQNDINIIAQNYTKITSTISNSVFH